VLGSPLEEISVCCRTTATWNIWKYDSNRLGWLRIVTATDYFQRDHTISDYMTTAICTAWLSDCQRLSEGSAHELPEKPIFFKTVNLSKCESSDI
jgi:hypothetical protein